MNGAMEVHVFLPPISYDQTTSSLGQPLVADYSTTAVCIFILSTVLEGRYSAQSGSRVSSLSGRNGARNASACVFATNFI